MTKEDILHHFQDINFYYNDCMMYDDLSRMLDELIAENDGDLISRQAVIDAIQKLNIPEDMCVFEIISHIEVAIATLPSVENKGEWIPVSERLPKAYQKVLVTYEEIHWANEPTTYGIKLISFGGVVDFIAWQPLPEPYKAESEEKPNDNT